MKDKRNTILAQQLLDYSVKLEKGQTLYLETKGIETLALAKEIIRIATQKGAIPFLNYSDESIMRHFIMNADEDQIKAMADLHLPLMQKADAYIGVRGSDNAFDLADVPREKIDAYMSISSILFTWKSASNAPNGS